MQRLAAEELEVQAELLDGMGLGPEAVVVLHVGGGAGGKDAAIDRFRTASSCSRTPRAPGSWWRTTTARSGCATCWRCIAAIGRPVVWDILHHHCNDPDGSPTARRSGSRSARGRRVCGRRSTTRRRGPPSRSASRPARPPLPLRAHADMIDPIGFERFVVDTAAGLELDVMLEAKAKDLALLRLREQLAARGVEVG